MASLGTLTTNASISLNLVLLAATGALGPVTNSTEVFASSLPDPILFNNRVAVTMWVLVQDSDQDGLPDDWELAHGLNPTNALDATLDSDCDGQSNLQEYLAGTDPLRFEHVLLASPRLVAPGRFELTVQAQVGKSYTLETSTNLISWSALSKFVLRNAEQRIQTPFSRTTTSSFFRLRTDTNAPLPLLSLLNASSLSTNAPLIQAAAPPGHFYSLQTSTDLDNWTSLSNYFGMTCTTVISDPTPPGGLVRFYRILVQ